MEIYLLFSRLIRLTAYHEGNHKGGVNCCLRHLKLGSDVVDDISIVSLADVFLKKSVEETARLYRINVRIICVKIWFFSSNLLTLSSY